MSTTTNNSVKNYNGVTIEKSWTFVQFAKEFGTPKLAKNLVNKETGEIFDSVVFDNNGELTFCHFGYSTADMDIQDIRKEKNNLKVGLNTSGKYTLYKSNGGWEEI